jgi:hypothetical protein
VFSWTQEMAFKIIFMWASSYKMLMQHVPLLRKGQWIQENVENHFLIIPAALNLPPQVSKEIGL